MNVQPAQDQMGLGWPSVAASYPQLGEEAVAATTGLGWPVRSDGLSEQPADGS